MDCAHKEMRPLIATLVRILEHVAAREVQAAGHEHVEELRQVDEAPDVGVVVFGLNQVRMRLVRHGLLTADARLSRPPGSDPRGGRERSGTRRSARR
jgi:hypothetical protein